MIRTKAGKCLPRQPFVVNVVGVACSCLNRSFAAGPLASYWQKCLLSEHQKQHNSGGQENVQEKRFAIQTFFQLNDLYSFIENGVLELISQTVAIHQVDVQAEGASGKCFGGHKAVCKCGFLGRRHLLVVTNCREVLDEEIEIHWVTERGVQWFDYKFLWAFVAETDQELNGNTTGKFWNKIKYWT